MTVYTPAGAVIATSAVTDPRSGNLSATIANLPKARTTSSKSRRERQRLGMGAYSLTIGGTSASVPTTPLTNTILNLSLSDNVYAGQLTTATQVDSYTIHAPNQHTSVFEQSDRERVHERASGISNRERVRQARRPNACDGVGGTKRHDDAGDSEHRAR